MNLGDIDREDVQELVDALSATDSTPRRSQLYDFLIHRLALDAGTGAVPCPVCGRVIADVHREAVAFDPQGRYVHDRCKRAAWANVTEGPGSVYAQGVPFGGDAGCRATPVSAAVMSGEPGDTDQPPHDPAHLATAQEIREGVTSAARQAIIDGVDPDEVECEICAGSASNLDAGHLPACRP